MATGRDLERLLTESGCSPSRLDTVGRKLRELGRLPNAGRGPYAPRLATTEAAALTLAYFGSGKSIRAEVRLKKLESLPSSIDGRSLLSVLGDLLEDPTDLVELRVSRIRRRARLFLTDGSVAIFESPNAAPSKGRFENEAVLDAQLAKAISSVLRGDVPAVGAADEADDSE